MTSNPHDSLVKWTFSQVEHAADLFRTSLPPELVSRLDLGTLALCPGSFVDEALRGQLTDLLYTIEIGSREAFLYLLLEHQSTVDRFLLLRLWRYMGEIWQGYRKEHPEAVGLPAIIPVVLHHSSGGWTAPRTMLELWDMESETSRALAAHLPHLGFMLDDLSAQDDATLQARVMAAMPKITLWALKNARGHTDIVSSLRAWVSVLRELIQVPTGVAALSVVLRYIMEVSEVEPAAIKAFLATELSDQASEELMTTAERLREEGREQGRKQGWEQGREQALRDMLSRLLAQRFGSVPGPAAQRLAQASLVELEAWTERVLVATSLNELLGMNEPAGH